MGPILELTALVLLALNAAGTAGVFFRLGALQTKVEQHATMIEHLQGA